MQVWNDNNKLQLTIEQGSNNLFVSVFSLIREESIHILICIYIGIIMIFLGRQTKELGEYENNGSLEIC